ncbi:MAG: MCP four helix bundle domain-containing protein [Gemmatimonadaceae bacterium]|nr:MCP four helix bundle domain-containing protein [Gemmatimonadaceae bacterium]
MTWYTHLKLGVKLLTSFSALVAITAFVGVFSVLKMKTVNDQSTIIADNWLPSVEKTSAMNTATSDIRIAQFLHVVSTTDEAMSGAEKDIATLTKSLDSIGTEYAPLISSDAERALYDRFTARWKEYTAEPPRVWRRLG